MPDTIFRPKISNENDPILFQCNPDYSHLIEVGKYLLQIAYLIPGGYLNVLLIHTILFKHRIIYGSSSFFVLFSTDCVVSITMISTDLVVRAFIYFTPLCPILAPLFYEPLLVFKIIIIIIINHSKACKSIIQTFLVLNRMSCVLFPLKYGLMWKKPMKWIIISIFVIPFSIDWNLIISRVYMQPTFGGFYMEYIKKVTWASQSRFQLVFILIALIFTLVCTSVTFYTLVMLPKLLRKVEKTLSLASAYISMSFIVLAVFQILFAFFNYIFTTSAVFGYSLLSYDVLNVGSPIIMLCMNQKLRCHVFGIKKQPTEVIVTRVFSMSISNVQNESESQMERRRTSFGKRVNYRIE